MSLVTSHKILEVEFERRGLKIASKIRFLRVDMPEDSSSHALSFRREMFIQPEDIPKLFESMLIFFKNTTCWIFIAPEYTTCFICKQVIKDHTDGANKQLNTFDTLYAFFKERSIKIRFSKIIKKLKTILNSTPNTNPLQTHSQEEDWESVIDPHYRSSTNH